MYNSQIIADYCYLNDAMGWEAGTYMPKDYKVCTVGKECMTKKCTSATVDGLCYRDADACSRKLYKDLKTIWGNGEVLKLSVNKFNLVDVDRKDIRFSSDYIGPSRAWAKYLGIEDCIIGEYLLEARTIGGHIIWPVHQGSTINTSRAGGKSLFDRIDLTLYEIRRFYIGEDRTSKFPSVLWNVLHCDKEKDFLSRFSCGKEGLDGFKAFVDFWMLQDFVMDEDYKVISFATSSEDVCVPVSEDEPVFPGNNEVFSHWGEITKGELSEADKTILREHYSRYADNLINAIKKRSERIVNKL